MKDAKRRESDQRRRRWEAKQVSLRQQVAQRDVRLRAWRRVGNGDGGVAQRRRATQPFTWLHSLLDTSLPDGGFAHSQRQPTARAAEPHERCQVRSAGEGQVLGRALWALAAV